MSMNAVFHTALAMIHCAGGEWPSPGRARVAPSSTGLRLGGARTGGRSSPLRPGEAGHKPSHERNLSRIVAGHCRPDASNPVPVDGEIRPATATEDAGGDSQRQRVAFVPGNPAGAEKFLGEGADRTRG